MSPAVSRLACGCGRGLCAAPVVGARGPLVVGVAALDGRLGQRAAGLTAEGRVAGGARRDGRARRRRHSGGRRWGAVRARPARRRAALGTTAVGDDDLHLGRAQADLEARGLIVAQHDALGVGRMADVRHPDLNRACLGARQREAAVGIGRGAEGGADDRHVGALDGGARGGVADGPLDGGGGEIRCGGATRRDGTSRRGGEDRRRGGEDGDEQERPDGAEAHCGGGG